MLAGGFGFLEGPRWHEGALWCSDIPRLTVLRVGLDGSTETVVEVAGRPSGLGWLPDGDLVVVSMADRRLLRVDAAGTTTEHADVSALVSGDCNDMVVDGRGNAYVGNAGDWQSPSEVVLVTRDGASRVVAEDVHFPNGTAVTPDGATLVLAESTGARLTAFSIADDGSLTDRRVWAPLEGVAPDGICLDAEGAAWVADATGTACLRVHEGGRVSRRVDVGRHCFACALGGDGRTTLFVLAADGFDRRSAAAGTAAIEMVEVDVPGAGWP